MAMEDLDNPDIADSTDQGIGFDNLAQAEVVRIGPEQGNAQEDDEKDRQESPSWQNQPFGSLEDMGKVSDFLVTATEGEGHTHEQGHEWNIEIPDIVNQVRRMDVGEDDRDQRNYAQNIDFPVSFQHVCFPKFNLFLNDISVRHL